MWRILSSLDRINDAIGRAVSWLTLLMVVLAALTVMLRYVFNVGFQWLQESVIYAHAAVFLLGAAYALREDAHVRIDFLYEKMTDRGRAWVNICGAVLLLLPFAIAVFAFSYDYVLHSWALRETSVDQRGLPAVFLLKTLIWLFAIMLFLQALVQIGRNVRRLRSDADGRQRESLS